MTPLVEIRGLHVSIATPSGGRALVVRDVNLELAPGEAVGLVGESGSGKTISSLAVMGLLPPTARVESGEIFFKGEDLLKAPESRLRKLRGAQMAMVMQDPLTALDPSFTIKSQLVEALQRHRELSGRELDDAVVDALRRVHLPVTDDRLSQFPHQLSGGMRQRVVSAIALAGEPDLLMADEPTAALDVTTQARYLELLRELRESTGFGLLLVAHDLLIVRHVCQRVVVMYAGEVVEEGSTTEVFNDPQHPYTRGLLGAIPEIGDAGPLTSIDGTAPDPSDEIEGCRFAPRCDFAKELCFASPGPGLTDRGSDHSARCWGTEPGGWIGHL